jgi:NAD(P)-dependent dehydrogenase (short-subunit alcohol dehydrogenase family)
MNLRLTTGSLIIEFAWRYNLLSEMNGKTCIVTGSNSGIGKEIALALAKMRATVVMVVRNRERGQKACTAIIDETGNDHVRLMICDLASEESIRQFAKEFQKGYNRLDVLINNAGAIFAKRQTTVDGFERTLAVNYLGPFLLTHELLPLLKSNASSRIINVGSGTASSAKLAFDDLQTKNHYNAMKAYANSKLALTMYTYELARLLHGTGITVNEVRPGFVSTNLGRNSGGLLLALAYGMMRPVQISARKGAMTSVFLASAPEMEDVTGKCFYELHETETGPITHDPQTLRRLWEATMALLRLTD